ncbi:hypothetical protein J6590_053956 [Homalodisca vitripennis]|nr:hypothetical protein J6590_053956 [Homalodisca vitripennis]
MQVQLDDTRVQFNSKSSKEPSNRKLPGTSQTKLTTVPRVLSDDWADGIHLGT